jgi:hypothetical protein
MGLFERSRNQARTPTRSAMWQGLEKLRRLSLSFPLVRVARPAARIDLERISDKFQNCLPVAEVIRDQSPPGATMPGWPRVG